MSAFVYTRNIWAGAMAEKKTELVSFRTTPTFRAALKLAAERERRSQANFLEKLVLDYCAHQGIAPILPSRRTSRAAKAVRPRVAAAGTRKTAR
jgi:hypothetical protein